MVKKHNAFSVFVDETFRRRRNAGENNLDKARLFQTLGPEWTSFTDEQKQVYKDKAKYYNENPLPPPKRISKEFKNSQKPGSVGPQASATNSDRKPDSDCKPVIDSKQDIKPKVELEVEPKVEPKVDSQAVVCYKRPHEDDDSGAVVEHVVKKLKPGVPNYKNLKGSDKLVQPWTFYKDSELLNLLNRCSSVVESRYSSMDTIPLYSICTNILFKERKKIKRHNEKSDVQSSLDEFEDFYTPIEISIYAYSLKSGEIREPYWALINAGSPPLGSQSAALDQRAIHKITFTPMTAGYSSLARKDYAKIYREILKYTEDGERIMLVSDHRDIPQVEGSLRWLYNKACEIADRIPDPKCLTILPIVEYVSTMHHLLYKKLGRQMPRFGYPYWIKMKLESTNLDYYSTYMCKYHSVEENQCNFCAQLCAIKTFKNLGAALEEIYKIYSALEAPSETTDNGLESLTMKNCPESITTDDRQNSITTDSASRYTTIESSALKQITM